MKKIISLCATLSLVASLFAAPRPSLDGRAVVCETGAMPKGLFARTVGYLPGDSVTVSNPASGQTVDVLVLGALDASEGIAILLSPEAADKLAIEKDSDVQVKITKRVGRLDETSTGSAILASTISNSAETETIEETPEAEEIAEVQEETIEIPQESAENVEIAANDAAETVVEEKAEEIAKSEESSVEENGVVEIPQEETGTYEEVSKIDENASAPSATEDEYSPIVLIPAVENPPVVEEIAQSAEENASIQTSENVEVISAVEEKAPANEIASAEEKYEEKPVVEEEVAEKSYKDNIVPTLKDLKTGCYYVQIASLGSETNLESTFEKYGENYPMVFVPSSSGKSYQVIIGPVTSDEYGAVLQKFKSYGYKDSFLRKIK